MRPAILSPEGVDRGKRSFGIERLYGARGILWRHESDGAAAEGVPQTWNAQLGSGRRQPRDRVRLSRGLAASSRHHWPSAQLPILTAGGRRATQEIAAARLLSAHVKERRVGKAKRAHRVATTNRCPLAISTERGLGAPIGRDPSRATRAALLRRPASRSSSASDSANPKRWRRYFRPRRRPLPLVPPRAQMRGGLDPHVPGRAAGERRTPEAGPLANRRGSGLASTWTRALLVRRQLRRRCPSSQEADGLQLASSWTRDGVGPPAAARSRGQPAHS